MDGEHRYRNTHLTAKKSESIVADNVLPRGLLLCGRKNARGKEAA